MMLFLDAVDPDGKTREFSCELATLELGFDFLSGIVAKGSRIVKAYVKDGQQEFTLPIAAFDGLPFSVAIHTLQEEWQAILANAHYKALLQQDRVWIARQRVRHCIMKSTHHERMMSWLSGMRQLNSLRTKPELANQYERQLTHYRKQLAQARLRLTIRKTWLNQLLAPAVEANNHWRSLN